LLRVRQSGVEHEQIVFVQPGPYLDSTLALVAIGEMSEIRIEVHVAVAELEWQSHSKPFHRSRNLGIGYR
jgi:hypothetical protein